MRRLVIYTLLFMSVAAFAQKERSMARKGNRFYTDSAFTEAEVAYLKALDVNPDLDEAKFNLASSNIRQQKFDEAIEQLEVIASTTDDKVAMSEAYHNMGNAYLSKYQACLQDQEKAKEASKELDSSIESYKKALRNNPSDDETRYNLAVAQKLKEEGPPQQDQQQQDQEDQDQQDQDQKDQDQKDQDQKDQEQQQQDQQDQDQKNQEQQQQPNEISKEDAEKILNAMMQEEKELQEEQKEKQKAAMRGKRVEKDW